MATPEATPEVAPITSLLAHPLLQDTRFLVAAIVLFLSLVVFAVWTPGGRATARGKRGKRGGVPTVLLVGPSDAGKTALFAQLTQHTYPPTHTSIEPSTKTVSLTSPTDASMAKQVKLVDLPGHPRLRGELGNWVGETEAVVFVVDISAVVRNATAVAEHLAPTLSLLASTSSRQPHLAPPRLLLLANKTDLLIRPPPPPSPSPPTIPPATRQIAIERLRSILTREMDRLKSARATTAGKIDSISPVTGDTGVMGKLMGRAAEEDEGEDEGLVWGSKGPFRWDDVEGVEIYWAASALGVVKTGKDRSVEADKGDGLDDLKRFILDE